MVRLIFGFVFQTNSEMATFTKDANSKGKVSTDEL